MSRAVLSRFSQTFVFVLLSLGTSVSWAQAESSLSAAQITESSPQQVAQVEGVTEYVLHNGLRLLLAPEPSKPNVTVNMTYLVGARHENYGQTGMAHLLEHLLFRGTPSMPDALGEFSRRGLAANGSTSADRTNYYASFAADPDTLEWYINWQADAMRNATLSQEELDAEMTVVRNEMERGENNPFQILLQKMQATAYQWHNYGHSTIGARSDVENVDIAQLRAFYDEYYQPDNAVLIITGSFDVPQTLRRVEQAFAQVKRPERTLRPEYTVEPVQDGERHVTLKRQGGNPLAAALYHIPAAGDPDYIALDLGVDILGDTPSGLLYQDLVKTEQATQVFAFAASMHQPGYALFGAQLDADMDAGKTLQTLQNTLDGLAASPFTDEDLERAKNQWLLGWDRIYANPQRLASILSEAVAEGDWRLFFWFRDQVEQTSLEQVQSAIERWLVADNRTTGIYLPTDTPERAPATTSTNLAGLLKDYTGREGSAAIDAFDPSPDNLDTHTQRTVLALNNGSVELALLPKATRGERVEAVLRMQFGSVDSLRGYRLASRATAALLTHGTVKLNRQEISDRLDALRATLHFSGHDGAVSATLSSTQEHLPDLIRLTLHLLREANFPDVELNEYIRRARASIQSAQSDPQALVSQELAQHNNIWEPDDIRYTPSFDESLTELATLTRNDLQAFHEQFYGAGEMYFSAVGAFDPDAVKSALEEGLKGWKHAAAFTRIPHPYHPVEAREFHIDTPDKANAFYMSTLPVARQDTDLDFAALYLADYLLGGAETSRLWTRIRNQEGLSYNVRSSLDVSSFEPSGTWRIYAIFAPENTRRLVRAIDEELQRVIKEGFTEKEVEEGIQSLLNYRRLARTRDDVLARTWIHYLRTDRSFAWSQDIDDALKGLTASEVSQALTQLLDPAQFSTAIGADLTRQKEAN